MSDAAIELRNVTKRFKLYRNAVTGPLKELLFPWLRKRLYTEFLAVRDVTLCIPHGDVVGIVGPNGAGKTTLLKMIAGLLPVDQGQVKVDGRVTALLALGVGVHEEFTGRENVLYGGMLLGMSKAEVMKKLPEIIEFSELGEYIDRPFRTYSSGMKARLLFSVSMSIDPDILIVDEALATGDAEFVEKCRQRIRDICRSGATILFVSHNLDQVQSLCRRVVLMHHGSIIADGDPSDVIAQYNRLVFRERGGQMAALADALPAPVSGSGGVVLTDVRLRGSEGEEQAAFHPGGTLVIDLHYRRNDDSVRRVHLFVGILEYDGGRYVGEANTCSSPGGESDSTDDGSIAIEESGVLQMVWHPLLLLNNRYQLWVILYDGTRQYYCEYRGIKPFLVAREDNAMLRGDALFWHPYACHPREDW